jgi:hypothetical protein
MACHYLYLKDQREFFSMMKNRDLELIIKMVKCVKLFDNYYFYCQSDEI